MQKQILTRVPRLWAAAAKNRPLRTRNDLANRAAVSIGPSLTRTYKRSSAPPNGDLTKGPYAKLATIIFKSFVSLYRRRGV
ncbi:unnamed protein product [Somion occarium]|uniref:Uncharacterized protein n=1 Tax=Somion occarium TaxID=3059160 RepID=A0ABP1DSN0_9APHY